MIGWHFVFGRNLENYVTTQDEWELEQEEQEEGEQEDENQYGEEEGQSGDPQSGDSQEWVPGDSYQDRLVPLSNV
jgi:hypothetical protein